MNNLVKQFKDIISDLKIKIRSKFTKTLSIKTIGEYKQEIAEMLKDLEVISDYDTIDELIKNYGIQGTAEQYISLNKFYKDYYQKIITEVKKSQNTSSDFKNYVKVAEIKWERAYKDIIQYLYDKKQASMYGKMREDVHIYHANSFSDEPLPWNTKEEINEDRYNNDFSEGLVGLTAGASSGVIIAIIISSLSAAFHLHPKIFTGISTAVAALVGHYIQKHFFIDFTNYVKLKRYITHYPESFEIICDLMSKNAVKFQQKDPVKYKKILMNLKRLQQNPPENYRNYLDDEIDSENQDIIGDTLDIKDNEGNTIKTFGSDVTYDSSRGISRNRRRPLGRVRDYEMNDITSRNRYSRDDLDRQARDLLGDY